MALSNIQIQIVVKAMGAENAKRISDNLKQVGASATQTAKDVQAASQGGWNAFGKRLGEIERSLDAVFRAASHLQSMGNTIRKFGENVANAMKGATKQWEEYEFTLNRAAGALEVFDTQAPMYERLQTAINEVAKEVRVFPAEEVAEAMYFWGSTTGQVVESEEDLQVLMKGITPILKAAAITETDYGTAIKGVYSILQQYNMGLEDAGDVTAMLMLSTQKTALEFPDLINAFKMVGPVAAHTGASFEDVTKILGYLGDAGIRGTMAGRALRQMFLRMVKPTAIMTSTMDDLVQKTGMTNKSWHELTFPNGEFVGARKYIDLLAQATQNLNQDERQRVLGIMATANELGPLTVLINDQIKARREGLHILDEEKYGLANATEAFDKMFTLLAESWKGTLGYMANSIGPVIRLIGANIARMATPFLENLAKMAQGLEQFLKTQPQLVEWGVRFASIAAAVLMVTGVVISAVGVLVGLGAAIVFVVKASKGFYIDILKNIMGPIKLLAVAIPAIITALVTNFGGLRDAIGNVIGAFVELFNKLDFKNLDAGSILGELATFIMPALEFAAKAVAAALNGIADGLRWIADRKGAVDILQGMVTAAAAFMALKFAAGIVGLGGAFSGAITPLITFGTTMVRTGSIVAASQAAFGGWAMAVKKAVAMAALTVIAYADSVKIAYAQNGLWGMMGAAIKVFAGFATTSLRMVVGATGIGLILVALSVLFQAWNENWGGIQEKVGAVAGWIVEKVGFIGDALTAVGDGIKGIFGFIGETIDSVANQMSVTTADIDNSFVSLGISAQSGFETMRVAAQDAGLGFEEYRTRVAETMATHNMDVLAAMQRVEYDMLSTAEKTKLGVSESMSEATRDWGAMLAAGRGSVAAGAEEAVDPISDAVAEEGTEAVEETKLAMGDIVSTLSESRQSMKDTSQELADAIKAPFSANKRRLEIEAELSSQMIRDGLRSEDPRIRAQTAQFVEERLNQYEMIAPGALTAGKHVNPKLSEGINSNVSLAARAAQEVCRQTSTPIDLCANDAYKYGGNVSKSFAAGIRDYKFWASDASAQLAAAGASSIRGYSPPKIGPLKHVDDFGRNIAKTWALGFASAAGFAYSQAANVAQAAREGLNQSMGTNMSGGVKMDAVMEKHVSLSIDVSSQDGTVNSASLNQLNDIFTSDEFLSSLEHMATVS